MRLGNQGATIPFRNCTPQACQAITPLVVATLLYLLNTNGQVRVGYNVASGQPVNYQLPTNGFNQAYVGLGGRRAGTFPDLRPEAPSAACERRAGRSKARGPGGWGESGDPRHRGSEIAACPGSGGDCRCRSEIGAGD